MVGGQDELVFDGDSILVSASGEPLARGPQFEEALIVADLELPAAAPRPGSVAREDALRPAEGALPQSSGAGEAVDAGDRTVIMVERVALDVLPLPAVSAEPDENGPFWPRLDDLAEVYAALVLGTADYVRKNGFRSVLLALSGGIDSALVATIATDAVGPENVSVILMPSKWSSDHSLSDADDLVERQGIKARTIPIQGIVDAFRDGLGDGFPASGLPAENLQSRVRGVINMAVSNDEGQLVLTTGNKSEIAVGYSTLYGDSAGGFGPIKDVLKTLVWDLSRYRNSVAAELGEVPPIPENSISKPPSAELAPGQVDTDSLPDYPVLDALLDDYVEKDMGSAALIAAGHDPELVARVIRLVDLAEYKRRQYPPGPKISSKNFGRDRRLPITSRWRESL
jgi:NAD+ synthase (glutamine-hydrolysing)